MNKNELLLMTCLRQNSRASLTSLSKKTGIPISSIFDKLKRRYGSLITRHVSLLDFAQLGFAIKVHMLIKVGKNDKDPCRETLEKFFNINNLFKVNNGYDYLFEALFHNLKELDDFNDALERKFTITKRETYFVIEDIKKESFLADPHIVPYLVAPTQN